MFLKNGHRYITEKINEAVKNGSRTATVSGDFEARVLEPARMLYEAGYRGAHIREVLPKR